MHNKQVKHHIHKVNPELYERFFNNPESHPGYVWSYDRWIYNALKRFKELRSNGEQALDYFQDNIIENTLVRSPLTLFKSEYGLWGAKD